jgi:diguanylate cyclase (GGDEF)-like protein
MMAADAPTILIVEDDASVAQALSLHLRFRGFQVLLAPTVRDGLQRLARGGVSLVLTDVGLPDGTGHEMVRRGLEQVGRDGEERPEFVVMTANPTLDNALKALSEGACQFLQKPVSTAFLEVVVDRALELRRLRSSVREMADERRLQLLRAIHGMTANVGVVGMLDALLQAAVVLLAPGRAAIWLRGSRGEELAELVAPGAAPAADTDAREVADDAIRRGRLVRKRLREQVVYGVSVLIDGETEGAVSVTFGDEADAAPDVEDTLAELAACASSVVRKERLFADLQQSRLQIHSLFEVGLAMTSETSLQRLFEVVVESASRVCGADRCSLLLLEPDGQTLRIRASRGLDPEVAATVRSIVGQGVAGKVAESGQPLLVSNIETDSRFARPNGNQYNNVSLVSVPVLVANRVVGVLNVSNKSDGTGFAENDLNLMTLLASQAAVALDNAERYQDLSAKAITDGLTGVYLRRYFDECLEKAWLAATAGGPLFAVLMADIDHFKLVNDTYGHQAGDEALRAVAAVIRDAVRDGDLVARYGGEEFAVILARADLATACRVAERVREAIEAATITAGEHTVRVTTSLGVATWQPGFTAAEQVVGAADEALLAAKRGGRNQVVAVPGSPA